MAAINPVTELMECRCCGNVWDGNAQCYCMCYGCDKCTSPAPQPEPEAAPPSKPKTAAGIKGREMQFVSVFEQANIAAREPMGSTFEEANIAIRAGAAATPPGNGARGIEGLD